MRRDRLYRGRAPPGRPVCYRRHLTDALAVCIVCPQILGEFGKEVLYLKNRMGFVKLALRNGVPLVPAYVFGANDTFRTSSFLRRTRLAVVKNLR